MVEVIVDEGYVNLLKSVGKWTLVTGFPGFGYVGIIATRYIVTQLKAVKVGNILTKYMPDFIAFEEYGILSPYEVFMSHENKLLIIVNNATPPPPERVAYARALIKWAKSVGVREFILAGGLNSKFREGDERLRWLATTSSSRVLPEPKFHKGLYVIGPLALLFLLLEIEKIPAIMILPYTEPERYDPKAAAIFIEKLNELLSLNINVQGLIDYAKVVEEAEATLSESLKYMEDRRPKPYI